MAYTVPQLLIKQEFSQLSVFSESPLAALIIGPDLRTGSITSITGGDPGTGYVNPVVTVTGVDDTGTGAVITPIVETIGKILAIAPLDEPGSGYTTAPNASISGGGSGTDAELAVDITGGEVVVTVINGGSGYTAGAQITLSGGVRGTPCSTTGQGVLGTADASDELISVTLASSGSEYLTAPTVVLSGGTPDTAATIEAVISDGHVSINVLTPGSGYVTAPTVAISSGTRGVECSTTAEVLLGEGEISEYVVTNGGCGYTTGAVLTVTDADPDSVGAGATPTVDTVSSNYALYTGLSGEIGSVSSVSDIVRIFGSATDVNNTLAYGLYNAVINSNGASVYYASLATNNDSGWIGALALAEKRNVYYGIVPLTQSDTVANLVIAHVNSMSSPGNAKWRTCWLSPHFGDVATYVAAHSSATQNGNENTGPRRLHYVFPDEYYPAETPTTYQYGYFLAAALAGVRSGSVPHQSLTNTQVVGPYYLDKCVSGLTETQLNELAEAGTWIVTQAVKGGTAYTRHQLTGDPSSNINYREDSVTANVDSISYGLQSTLAPFIGIYNINASNIAKVRAAVDRELTYRLTNTYTSRAGNQLIGYNIVSIAQAGDQSDKLNVVVQLTVPYPMNFIEITLSV